METRNECFAEDICRPTTIYKDFSKQILFRIERMNSPWSSR